MAEWLVLQAADDAMQTVARLLPADMDEVAPWLSSDSGELIQQLFEVLLLSLDSVPLYFSLWTLAAPSAAQSDCFSLSLLLTLYAAHYMSLPTLSAAHYVSASGSTRTTAEQSRKPSLRLAYTLNRNKPSLSKQCSDLCHLCPAAP